MSAAVVAVLAWGLKAVAIAVAGGLDKSPFEGPLFFLGLAANVIAFVALGVAVAGPRGTAAKVGGAVLGIVVGFAVTMLADSLAGAVVPESAGWVAEEAGLWVAALLALGITGYWYRRSTSGRTGS